MQVTRDEYRLMAIAADVADRVLRGHGRPSAVIPWALGRTHGVVYPDGSYEPVATVRPDERDLFVRVVYRMVADHVRGS
jgi:hypothetical protein